MEIPTSSFTYKPLDSEQGDSFRLLSLLPGFDNSPIEYILSLTRRSTLVQPYEALSYAWGDPSLASVNGSLLPITQNLEHALRSLRPDSPNGGVAHTRNNHVAQMHDIYSGAKLVVI
jgi:hypothetical protein